MHRRFWNISGKGKNYEILSKVEKCANKYGYVVDFKKFSETEFCIIVEVEEHKIEIMFQALKKIVDIEKYNEIFLRRKTEDEVYLNVTVSELN